MINAFKNRRVRILWGVYLVFCIAVISLFVLFTKLPGFDLVKWLGWMFSGFRPDYFADGSIPVTEGALVILWELRLPRLIMGLVIGASLSVAGTGLQSLFRNPLVDPYITGISSGATLGAVFSILTGLSAFMPGTTISAFVFAMITGLVFYFMLGFNRKLSNSTILLIGIALNLFLSSVVTMLMIYRHDKLENIFFWIMGSLANSNWDKVTVSLPLFVIGFTGLFALSRGLDALAIDEEFAKTLGIQTQRYKLLVLFFTSLLVGLAVSTSGVIGFVGLVIPNIIRLVTGNSNRTLIPLSALIGALFLIISDWTAKNIFFPNEIQIGAVTSIIGVPVFIFLIIQNRRRIQ